MLGLRVGSTVAEYAQVQYQEPKTGQQKVQFYCEDEIYCQSGYSLSMVSVIENRTATLSASLKISKSRSRSWMLVTIVSLPENMNWTIVLNPGVHSRERLLQYTLTNNIHVLQQERQCYFLGLVIPFLHTLTNNIQLRRGGPMLCFSCF